jgi:hypothetical protein
MKSNTILAITKYCALVTLTALTSLAANAQVTSQACGPLNPVTNPTTPVPTTVPVCTNTSKTYTICEKPSVTPPVCITSTLDPTGIGFYDTNQLNSMNTKVADFVAAQRSYIAQLQGYNACLKQHCTAALEATPLAGQLLPQSLLNMQAECKKLTPPVTTKTPPTLPRKPEPSDCFGSDDQFSCYDNLMQQYNKQMKALGY